MSRKGKKFVGGYVPAALKKQLDLRARAEGRSVTNMLARFLELGVKHQDKPAAAPAS